MRSQSGRRPHQSNPEIYQEHADDPFSMPRHGKSTGGGRALFIMPRHDKSKSDTERLFTMPRHGKSQAEELVLFQTQPVQESSEYRLSRRWDPSCDLGHSYVQGAYKRKANKIQPVDQADPLLGAPRTTLNWKKTILAQKLKESEDLPPGPFDQLITRKFSLMPRGTRLTEERRKAMKIGDALLPQEKELLFALLSNREQALAWEFAHLGRFISEVAPPQKINTVPHKAWQHPGFSVPRALEPVVVKMLQERINAGILEYCQGPTAIPGFL